MIFRSWSVSAFLITSAIFFIIACCSFLWFLSSSSLDFLVCDGHYSFLAVNPQCRHPAIASALFLVTLVISIACLLTGYVKLRIKNTLKRKVDQRYLVHAMGFTQPIVASGFSIVDDRLIFKNAAGDVSGYFNLDVVEKWYAEADPSSVHTPKEKS